MGLYSQDWKTDKPKKLAKALAWLETSTNQELGTMAVEAPLEEVALAACEKLPKGISGGISWVFTRSKA